MELWIQFQVKTYMNNFPLKIFYNIVNQYNFAFNISRHISIVLEFYKDCNHDL